MSLDPHVRAALELLPVIAFTATEQGAIDWVSERWYEATGISREAVLGEAWVHVVHPEDIEQVVWRWTRALDTGRPWEATPRVRHADGTYHWYFTRAERVENAASAPFWIGTTIDLSALPWRKIASLDAETADEGEQIVP
jgi:PAS domain S-box-containing protein